MNLLCGPRPRLIGKKGEDIWTASDGQKVNHQGKYEVEGE